MFKAKGLAYLLAKYCDIKANKLYQLADWRRRPLTREMVHYARQDTHYLLYIYDRIRTELKIKAKNEKTTYEQLMQHILNQSKRVCLLIYKKPVLRSFQYK